MKKLAVPLLTLMLVLTSNSPMAAQGLPVYDNTNFLSLAKQLLESAKQTAELLKMVEHFQAVKEKIEKVNNAVKQYQAVREITRNNEKLFQMVNRDLRAILNSPYIQPDEIQAISRAFNGIIDQSLSNLEFMNQVLSNDFLNMSDAERLEVLEQHRRASQKMVAEIRLKNIRYRTVISFREMKDKINNRTAVY